MASSTQLGAKVESFGARLKRERERQGILLEDVAISTKIGTRMLQALEEEHFDQLPGGIFNKGFVRAYARHLGLDEDRAVADYMAAAGALPPPKEPEAVVAAMAAHSDEARHEKKSARGDGLPWGKLAILLLLLAFGVALWGSHSQEFRKPPHPPASQQLHPARLTAPVVSSASTRYASATPAPAVFVVLIKAREDSWVTVTADGKQIMGAILPAHGEQSVAASQEITVRAGNTGGLDFWFNGRQLPIQGEPDQVKTLTFHPAGLQ